MKHIKAVLHVWYDPASADGIAMHRVLEQALRSAVDRGLLTEGVPEAIVDSYELFAEEEP